MREEDLGFVDKAVESALRWGIDIHEPARPDIFIRKSEKASIGNHEFEIIETPGHSPGGVSFYLDGILFSGDCLFDGSIGRTDFRGGSLEILTDTIKSKLYVLPDDTTVYTGHGPCTKIGYEKINNPFVNMR